MVPAFLAKGDLHLAGFSCPRWSAADYCLPLLLAPRACLCVVASRATPLSPASRRVEWVALLAVGLGCILRCWANATQDVSSASHWLKMIRVDAAAISAKVVKDQAVGDWSDTQFISQPVSAVVLSA